MIAEFRSTGAQTMMPGSVHPCGEAVEWSSSTDVEPAHVDGDELMQAARRTAAASLLARHWGNGARHDLAGALAGGLLRAGWPVDEVAQFITAVSAAAGDEEPKDRARFVHDTERALRTGDRDVTGWPRLAELMGREVVGKVTDWLGIGIRQLGLDEAPAVAAGRPASTDDLPTIELADRQLRDITDDALTALFLANDDDPSTFVRSGGLVGLVADHNRRHTIQAHSVDTMRGRLSRVADWQRTSKPNRDGETSATACSPKHDVVTDVLSQPDYSVYDIPPLEGVVTGPVVTPERRIQYTPGYDPETRLYLIGGEIDVPSGPPTMDEVEAAKHLILREMLGEFPFVDDASKANVVAMLLQPHCRPAINGSTPLYAFDAPVEGTGKGLLADAVIAVYVPTGATVMTPGENEGEWRKRITAAVGEGTSHIVIDNVEHRVDSGSLSSVLTADIWSDRRLGVNEMVQCPVRCTWVATGNNVTFSGEMARRVCWIRLNAHMEQPYMRQGFRHHNLMEWVKANRPELVGAVLVLIRAWIAAGCPEWAGRAPGSYTAWAKILGGILEEVGIPGFLENADELYVRLNPDRAQWRALVTAWGERHGTEGVTSRELLQLHDHLELDIIADGEKAGSRVRKMGKAISKQQDRVYGEWAITRAGTAQRAALWALKPASRYDPGANSPCENPCHTRGIEGSGEFGEFPYTQEKNENEDEKEIVEGAKPTHQTHVTHREEMETGRV